MAPYPSFLLQYLVKRSRACASDGAEHCLH